MFNTLKKAVSVVSLAAILSVSGVLVPAVSQAAPPPPRGGVHAVRHCPAPRPALRQPRPAIHRPPLHRPSPVYHRPVPRPHWRPAPPPPRPRYDRHASRDRRIARGAAAVAVIAALFGAR